MRLRWRIVLVIAVAVIGPSARAEVSVRPTAQLLIKKFAASINLPFAKFVEADVPAVGCAQDGQVGFQSAPSLPKTVKALILQGTASSLAYYSAHDEIGSGVLAPRGWKLFWFLRFGRLTSVCCPFKCRRRNT
jgi:hypothetical protein